MAMVVVGVGYGGGECAGDRDVSGIGNGDRNDDGTSAISKTMDQDDPQLTKMDPQLTHTCLTQTYYTLDPHLTHN